MHNIQMSLGVISPEIHEKRDQTFEVSAFKNVISPEILRRRDQMHGVNASKDVINTENS